MYDELRSEWKWVVGLVILGLVVGVIATRWFNVPPGWFFVFVTPVYVWQIMSGLKQRRFKKYVQQHGDEICPWCGYPLMRVEGRDGDAACSECGDVYELAAATKYTWNVRQGVANAFNPRPKPVRRLDDTLE
ncbi:MAG: hypothetical protein AAGD00_00110 [Planctomycetota bacterium]